MICCDIVSWEIGRTERSREAGAVTAGTVSINEIGIV